MAQKSKVKAKPTTTTDSSFDRSQRRNRRLFAIMAGILIVVWIVTLVVQI